MRKSLVLNAAYPAVVLPLFFVLSAQCQAPSTSSTQQPDPKELMHSAVKLNNLCADDVKPWHIKATFQLFDEQGTVTDEGTYDESWASPFQFRRAFTGKNFSEVAYGTKKGVLLSNTKGDFPDLLLAARNNLVSPMPYFEEIIRNTTYTIKPLNSGTIKLICAVPTGATPGAPADSSAYCFDTDEPILRIAARPSTSDQTFHNRLIRFEDRSIAGDLKIEHKGNVSVALHVESATVVDESDKGVFTPPADAVPAPVRVTVSGAVVEGMLIHKVAPEYPITAKRAHITGTVVLKAIIGTNGRLRDIKPVSGPEALQGSAMQAVYQWRYRPYIFDGKPVEVMTTINVVFGL